MAIPCHVGNPSLRDGCRYGRVALQRVVVEPPEFHQAEKYHNNVSEEGTQSTADRKWMLAA